jgi:hypothetical protein
MDLVLGGTSHPRPTGQTSEANGVDVHDASTLFYSAFRVRGGRDFEPFLQLFRQEAWVICGSSISAMLILQFMLP